jgi:diacylglycerol kinase (ATP)
MIDASRRSCRDAFTEFPVKLNPIRHLKNFLHHPLRAKLIFNPGSGQPEESPQKLLHILSEMQEKHILPEVFISQPDSDLKEVVHGAIKAGIKLIVVAGGDGTIDCIVGAMIDKDVALGIIPTGTRNNVAFNLGITGGIAECVALLRDGHRLKIDVGQVHCGHSRHWFLEAAAMGLITDIYPMLDNIQHGNLAQVGELISTLVSATPSELQICMDEDAPINMSAHMMLIANMPFIGPHFQISPHVSFKDGLLDVFTFSDMSKVNVLSYAMLSRGGEVEHADIKHYQARHIRITSQPRMPVLADGTLLGQGSLSIHVHPRALTVMAGAALTGQPTISLVVDSELEAV